MAGAGYKLFTTGSVLTAADVNQYLNEQTVMVFADAAARTTALSGVLAEGMVSYLKDTNATEVYDGSAWVGIGNSGDITGVTAGTGISGGGTSGTVTITNSMATEITAAGDIIVGTGSGTFDNLPIGTTGQVLTADTTVSPYKVKWASTSSATGLTYITGGTFTTASSIALSSGALTSTYKNYVVVFNTTAVSTAGGCDLLFQFNEGGTAKSTSNYYGASNFIGYTSDSVVRSSGTTSFRFGSAYGTSFPNTGATIELYNIGESRMPGIAGTGHLFSAAAGQVSATSFGAYFNSNITADGFTITTSTGTISGFYRVYGRNQS